ncbi:MAG TPA: FAD-binding and (Fe-S)-binding domain-containing protein [Streptosporangiaceae bacterium]|nr:FAD-binding and (Fe-S)-binding domain-containing protein [Streptosporangiaceae bacterium]
MPRGEPDVVRDLRSRGVSEVDIAPRRLAEYASDASLYRVVPTAVAFPRGADDITAALQTCREHGVPLTMRGAGTSIAGNAVGPGVVLDVSRHLHRVLSVDPDARTATVEPGVVLDDLQRAAARYGLRFGPDPSTHSRCTIGGMIGNNACGSRALRYGRTADNVLGLTVLTGGGELLDIDRDPVRAEPVRAALTAVVTRYLGTIRTELGRFGRQVSGYSLEHLLPERGFDVAAALVGTEGTCAITTRAMLRLVPAPAHTALVVLHYASLADAADAAPALLPLRPTAMEGLDARIIDLVRVRPGSPAGAGARVLADLPGEGGLLLVELAGDTQAEAAAAARAAVAAAGFGSGAAGARSALVAADREQAAAVWRIREDGAGLVARPAGGRAYHAGWEDAAVPADRLGDYLRAFDALLAEHGLHGLPYGHFGDGCVHVRLDFDFDAAPGERARAGPPAFRRFLLDAADLVAAHGGSMSGEHGDGRARSELLPRMYSPAALAAFGAVKAVFDPDGVLNPGVIVAPRPVDADLRPARRHRYRAGLGFRYPADDGDFGRAVSRCTGVAKCRADLTAAGGVMCPSYLATRDEKDSTRARARVLQDLVSGAIPGRWRSAEVAQSLELCLACKACSADCPTGTDMATYKAEALYQRYRGRLRPPAHYALGWLPRWARVAARAPRLANALLTAPGLAPLGARLVGVDPRRRLPAFARTSFRDWFAARGPAESGGVPVVLWADTFTNYFTPQVGIAAVTVLEAAGYAVTLSRDGDCCGLTWLSTGQLGTARAVMSRALAGLAPSVRAGTPVVGLEPSCVAAFRGDAADLADPSVAGTGAAVRTLAELLAATPGWQPPPQLSGLRAVAQPHCHHHAVLGWDGDAALLAAGGATVRRVGGCCGLAGNFGMERGHYELSVAVARSALLPALADVREGNGVVIADGFSCRTQIAQLAGRRAYHLAELLAAPPFAAPAAPGPRG